MQWYDKYKRTLPWRTESPRDPYKVWVSEIMLQQTRVEAVKSYYTNWMEHFPDIPTLAAAEEEDVVRLLTEEYDVDEEVATADAKEWIKSLKDNGLIEV